MMSIINIPQEFISEKIKNEAYIIDYTHKQNAPRQKVSFDYYTISFLIEGVKEIYSSTHSEKIIPSNFLVVKRGNCLMTETLSNNSRYRSKLILFSKDFLLQFISKYNIDFINKKTNSFKRYKVLAFDDYIKLYIESINTSIPSERMQVAKVEELLVYCYEKYGNQLFSFLNEEGLHYNMRQVIENHLTKNLSVEELAFLCNMSISTFKRAFYQEYQSTPSKWIKKQRLELSKNDLKNGNSRASDIYLKYGFGSLSRFISAFKCEYGITPKQFQQNTK